ncbi:MAG: acyl-CoA dehydrogenase [Gammaproteobacteria bacterium]|nr:acyl-CoA dehydrogenase [Gammaproteobacteria bacterium]
MYTIPSETRYGLQLAEAAYFFREIAFEVESNHATIFLYLSHPGLNILTFPEKVNCEERIKIYEALSYGDAGVLLACPGSSLSGFLIDQIGSAEQKKYFYQQLEAQPMRTFLAVTEPLHGSNLATMQTQFSIKKESSMGELNGEKWLISHGATGGMGVVIVKTGEGPLCKRALLLTPQCLQKTQYIQKKLLSMSGLTGACLSQMLFKNCPVEREWLLGNHVNYFEHGMMALLKTFNQMRPCVGAMAIGVAQAALDYYCDIKKTNHTHSENQLISLQCSIDIARNILCQAARYIDKNPLDGSLSSLAKSHATKTAEYVVTSICDMLNQHEILFHPHLMKWYRDIWGFEYMEGTSNIHKINAFNAYKKMAG